MTGLPQLAFGTAVLTAERLTGRRTSPGSPVAVVIGLAGLGRQGAAMAASSTDTAAKRQVMPEVSRDGLRKLVRDAGTRGAISMVRSRRAAQVGLTSMVDSSLAWMIDRVMPLVKEKIIPAVAEDMADDPKVREAVTTLFREQGQGMITDATLELRENSAAADDRVESAFQRMLRYTSDR